MRINEEIDALEVIGIRSITYLASTRVLAGVVVVIPLYCVAVLMAFLAARIGTTAIYGQSSGVYDHYFDTFLNPDRPDLVVLPGGDDGGGRSCWCTPTTGTTRRAARRVGEAVGRAVRTSMIVAALRDRVDLAGHLRPVRQLQPGG